MKLFYCFFLCLASVIAVSQENFLIVKKIQINGNDVTKEKIVRRELLFSEGDTVFQENLAEKIRYSKYNLQNTRLFNFVNINYEIEENNAVNVEVNLTERWYIWPIPLLEYAEPNLTTFLRNRDFSRIDYGGYLIHENFRGRREVLKAIVRQGFDKQYALEYTLPYVNPKKTLGLYFRAGYNFNHTVTVTTEKNQRVFYSEANTYTRKQPYFTTQITLRHKYFAYHTIGLHIHRYITSDSLNIQYPDFLKSANGKQEYKGINYAFYYNRLDWVVFPLKGYYFFNYLNYAFLSGTTLFSSTHAVSFYQSFGERWFMALQSKVMKNWLNAPPYYLMSALGYKDNLRGFDNYIIDGTDFFLLKTDIKYQWLKVSEKKLPGINNEKFSKYFLYGFAAPFFDVGYVYWKNPGNNFLQNHIQYSTGMEFSFVTYYNIVMQFDAAYLSTREFAWAIRVQRVF
ncbi:MAG: hypothetical protein D6707_00685 [Bacteroidetes bacterium]|nr:MAG: hypothetical protein D6707_00685 [Bacteroidota bacterium]